jgi:hypothetical protein
MLGNPSDHETVRNVVAAAQVAYRCDVIRGDPAIDLDKVTRAENMLRRRLHALGIIRDRDPRTPRTKFTES